MTTFVVILSFSESDLVQQISCQSYSRFYPQRVQNSAAFLSYKIKTSMRGALTSPQLCITHNDIHFKPSFLQQTVCQEDPAVTVEN